MAAPAPEPARPSRPPSDSSGRVVLSGLPNWQRRPKPSSTRTTTSASQSKSTSVNTTQHGDARSGKRQRTGEGMGMQSTPAKKRKTKSIASIGSMSTPKTKTKPRAPKPSNDDSSSSEASSPDTSVTSIDASDPPISSADESLTSPSLSLSLPTIDVDPIMTLPSAYISHSSRTDDRQRRSSRTTIDTLGRTPISTRTFGGSDVVDREMSVPLNDLTSIPTHTGSSELNSLKSTPTTEESNEKETTMQAKDLTVSHNDFSISTIKDDTDNPSRRRKASKPPSKISSRQTTPYRLPASSAPGPLDTDPSSRFDVDYVTNEQSLEMARGAQSPRSPYLPAAIPSTRKFPLRIKRATPDTPSPLKRAINLDISIMTLDEDTASDRALKLDDVDGEKPITTVLWGRQGHQSANERLYNWPDEESRSSRVQSEGDTDSNDARDGDPFGFLNINRIVRVTGRIPQEWCSSSQEGSPQRHHSLSPISFTASLSASSSPIVSSAIGSIALFSNKVKSLRVRAGGAWRGAKVLARMEGRASPIISSSVISSDEDDYGAQKGSEDQSSLAIHTTQLSEAAKQAREARIAHYKDIEQNWDLKVEYVWC